ncbi:MAG: lipopolysaccharide biosynthesis protein [Steroidobacteraceae bacterium]
MSKDYFGSTAAGEDLHRQSLRSGAVSMLAQGANMVVQFLSAIVLARLLLPEDFGLVAMVAAITGFASIFVDLGTRDALSQRESITEGEVSALFWINSGVGLVLTVMAMICSPLIARFYGEPRLVYITLAMALTFVLPSLYYAQYAIMRRALKFRQLAMVEVGANLLATLVTVVFAYETHSYWALVAKPVLKELFTAISVWATCGWHPGRPTFTPGVRDMLKFGINILGFAVTDYVAKSADRVALGYTTGPRDLGYYQNALVIYDNPLALFTLSLHGVAVATLTKLRGNLESFRRAWTTALSSLVFFAAPAFAILAVTAQDLVIVLLGGKWAHAGLLLTVMALRGPAHVVERTIGWLHVAAGRTDRWRRWGFVSCGVFLAALGCGLPFGVIGVVVSYTAFTYVVFVPAILYAGRALGISARHLFTAVGPQLIVALATAGVGLSLRYTVAAGLSPFTRLVMLTVVCGGLYLAVTVRLLRITQPIQLAVSLLGLRRESAK